VDLFHDLSVDPIADSEKSIPVDPMNRSGQDGGDARNQPSILSIEVAAWSEKRDRAPRAASPPNGSDQHISLDRRMRVPDVPSQHAQVPGCAFGQREQQIRFGTSGTERGNAAMRGAEEVARISERVPQRLVRFPDLFQMGGQAVDELQRRQFTLHRQHDRSGLFSNGSAIKVHEVPHHDS
jgi:hypothetical protein